MYLSNEYLAGFFDGEGCVSIYRNKLKSGLGFRYAVNILICSTNLDIIKYLQLQFGGTVYNLKMQKVSHKQAQTWVLGSRSAKDFLIGIYPFLIIKKEQVKLALEFIETIGNKGVPIVVDVIRFKREELFQQLKILNRRGSIINTY